MVSLNPLRHMKGHSPPAFLTDSYSKIIYHISLNIPQSLGIHTVYFILDPHSSSANISCVYITHVLHVQHDADHISDGLSL
jgi:hypothetical protein